MKRLSFLAIIIFALTATACQSSFSKGDKEIISGGLSSDGAEPILHIYTVDNPAEYEVLRTPSVDMSLRTIKSEEYKTLARRMVTTVSDTTVGGVGIAGPQVGINKRVVAVQRFDKEGEPFEVYPNIRIICMSDSTRTGFEGCLSVPNRRGEVVRSAEVVISYIDTNIMKPVTDTITGFTAVIFQHEVDHLEGIIYTDKLK